MSRQEIQYTIRQIPAPVDKRLRQKAKEEGMSLNQIVVEALMRQTGISDKATIYHDLDDLAGTWEEDSHFDEAIQLQHRIDSDLWK